MDSFDQSAAATLIEQQVCDWIIRLVGSVGTPAAIFTTGGTQSNYLALLLARDRLIDRRWQWSVQHDGLPPQAIGRLKILCSESAHFSVVQAAHQLGLGTAAVITVPVDTQARMRPDELQRLLDEQAAMQHEIIAVVATAGTTDAGAFDPILLIHEICKRHKIWLHVDAAWGGAVFVSTQHRAKLRGVELADSVALDFHKGFYQPISCSAVVVRDDANFEFIRHHSDYLNPFEHEELGVPDLVTRSLLTTRRFDSLKLWFSLRVCGVETLGAMVDQTISLAAAVGEELVQSEHYELCCTPEFSSILFRLRPTPGETGEELEELHAYLPTHLLHAGRGIIGFSKWRDQRCLKLTLLNPCTGKADILVLLDIIFAAATEYRKTR
jgi:L-2,4-diaminobutyrate decarboxylase